jgi:hypothetical protein
MKTEKERFTVFFAALILIASFLAVMPAAEALSPDDLPGAGEELIITSDDTLNIAAGETAELGGTLIVRSTAKFYIANHGEFTIEGSIEVEGDNTVVGTNNYGTLNMYGARIETRDGGLQNWYNIEEGEWNINDAVLETVGGRINWGNEGELNINDAVFETVGGGNQLGQ